MHKNKHLQIHRITAILLVIVCTLAFFGCTKENDTKPTEPITLDSLNGKPVGVLTGSTYAQYATEYLPTSEQLSFNDISDIVFALTSEKIDSFIIDEPVARMILARNPEVTRLTEVLRDDAYAVAFAKTASGRGYCEQFNEFLRKLNTDGTIERLQEQWFGADESAKVLSVPNYKTLPATNGTLKYAISAVAEPFSYMRDGVYVGYELELVTRFCMEYGYALELNVTSFASLIPGLSTGKYDLCSDCISITDERKQSVYFSEPTYIGGVVVVCRNQKALSTDGARLGSLTGTVCEAVALEHNPKAIYSGFASFPDCAVALKSGLLDYVALPETNAVKYMREDSGYQLYGDPMDVTHVNIGITKSKPELQQKIDALIDKYRNDGTLDRIYSNWIKTDGSDYVVENIPEREDGEVLRVATTLTMEPTGFMLNGQPAGYDMDIARLLAYDLNMRLEIIDMDFNGLIPAVQSNRADAIVSFMVATEERKLEVNFSQSYFDVNIVLMTYDASGSEKVGFFQSLANSFEKSFIREQRWKLVLSGIGITFIISICVSILGTLIGAGICAMKKSRLRLLQTFAKVYIRILQGMPLVVLLMILYYIVFNKTGLDGVTVAIIAFAMNFGAYSAEIFKSGIDAVDPGQYEAAMAAGFNRRQTFGMIILPQAARHFLPVLKGEFVTLVKMTSIVGYIAVQDLTKVSEIIRSRTYEAFFPLIVTAIIYFLLSWGLSSLLTLFEVRIDPTRRRLPDVLTNSDKKTTREA